MVRFKFRGAPGTEETGGPVLTREGRQALARKWRFRGGCQSRGSAVGPAGGGAQEVGPRTETAPRGGHCRASLILSEAVKGGSRFEFP